MENKNKYYRWFIIAYGVILALIMVIGAMGILAKVIPNPFDFNLLTALILCSIAIQTLNYYSEKAEDYGGKRK